MAAGDDYEIAMRLKHLGRIFYDSDLYVLFSMRRMEKFGVTRALYIWAINVVAEKRGKCSKLNYMRQIYK